MGFSWSIFGFSSIHNPWATQRTEYGGGLEPSHPCRMWGSSSGPLMPGNSLSAWLRFSQNCTASAAFSSNISVCLHNFQTCLLVWRLSLLLLPLLSPFSITGMSLSNYLYFWCYCGVYFSKALHSQWVNSENFLHQEFQDHIYIYTHTHTHIHIYIYTYIHTHHLIQQFQQAYLNI